MMHTLAKGALATALLITTIAAGAGRAAEPSPMHVDFSGVCSVQHGVSGNWDVYQEIFQAGSPTWLPAHIHDGVECTVAVRGTADWWLLRRGIIPLPAGKTFFTAEHVVHTAGNASSPQMAYLAVHVITAGEPFRRLVNAPTAPKEVTTATKSIFKTTYLNQPSSHRAFDIVQRLETLAPGSSFSVPPIAGTAYYTITSGGGTLLVGSKQYSLRPFHSVVVPRGAALRISNHLTKPLQLAVCELRDAR